MVKVSMSTEKYPWEFSVTSAPGNGKLAVERVFYKVCIMVQAVGGRPVSAEAPVRITVHSISDLW